MAVSKVGTSSLGKKVLQIMKGCGINCYPVDGNKKMIQVGIDIADENQVIEFDIMGYYNTTGFIIEDTTQKDNNIDKIKRFQQKCNYFKEAFDAGKINFKIFENIPTTAITKFKQIKEWKFIYIGTGEEMIRNKITEKQIPARKNLFVLNKEHLAYLDYLVKRVGPYAKQEILERLGVEVKHSTTELDLKIISIQLENKKILGHIPANVFLFQLPAEVLLRITHVPRYGSLKPWMPEVGSEDYQRLLNQNKIDSLASLINSSKELTSFPNALTVVLSDDVDVVNPKIKNEPDLRKLHIPYRYGIMEIIDGQHRLFAFAKSKLTEQQKYNSKLIVIGIQFKAKNIEENQRLAAKTFVDINREQTKVPTELTYWLGYSTLGETNPEYLAARILIDLETTKDSNLRELFHTRPFQKTNRIGGKPIKIVTVANELSKIVDIRKSKLPENKKLRILFSNKAWKALEKKKDGDQIIKEGYEKLNSFFGIVKSSLPNDWNSNSSLIFSSKYIAAFMRLFMEYKKLDYSDGIIATKLRDMNSKVKTYLKSHGEKQPRLNSSPVVLWKEYENIPSLKDHVSSVIDFMLEVGL
ncbi:MAG: DGQHR domain-containing protein [Nitrososphaeraceae archaeon]